MIKRIDFLFAAAVISAALSAGLYASAASARDEVCVYDKKDYAGDEFCTTLSISNLADEDWNDQIASVEIRGDLEVVLYADAGYTGHSIHLSGNASRLRKGMDGNTSSLKIVGMGSGTGSDGDTDNTLANEYPAGQGWQLQQFCSCKSGKRCYVRGNEVGACVFECPSGCKN